jgi:hypothetical protein
MITDANRSNDAVQQLNLLGTVLLILRHRETQKMFSLSFPNNVNLSLLCCSFCVALLLAKKGFKIWPHVMITDANRLNVAVLQLNLFGHCPADFTTQRDSKNV